MSTQVYIDDELIDLGKDTKVGITLQVNDIAEMKDRNGSFSNTFKVPKTQTNKAIFGHADVPFSSTNQPYRKLPAKVVQDGIELVSSGYSEFKSAGDSYENTIFSGILDFFAQIKGKKLTDIDMSSYDHIWDIATVVASRLNTSGYIYPLIDYNDDQAYMNNLTRNVDTRTLFPAVFVHTIVEKIFAGTDYTVGGAVLSTTKYLKRLFPFALDKLQYSEDYANARSMKVKYKQWNNQTVSHHLYSFGNPAFFNFDPLIFSDESSIPSLFDPLNQYNPSTGIFTCQKSGIYTLTFDLDMALSNTDANASVDAAMVIRKKASTFPGYVTLASNASSFTGGASYINTLSVSVQLAVGDQIYCVCGATQTSVDLPGHNYLVTVRKDSSFSATLSRQIIYAGNIFMSSILPAMSQEDFLKTIAMQLGIIFVPDNVNKIIYMKQFEELYANKINAADMTDKLDMASELKISFRESGYAQKNNLRYKPDASVPAGLGDGFFTINDEILDPEKDLFVLPISATEDVVRLIGLNVCKIPKLHAGAMTKKTEWRMVMLNTQNITSGGNIIYGVGNPPSSTMSVSTSIPLTYFIDDTQNDSLGFDRFLIASEYNEYANFMMQQFKKIEGKFNLNIKDVQNFDHLIPWYLQQFSSYFYVNIVKNFVKNKLTTVELIRM